MITYIIYYTGIRWLLENTFVINYKRVFEQIFQKYLNTNILKTYVSRIIKYIIFWAVQYLSLVTFFQNYIY